MIAIDMTYISLEQLKNGQLTEGINIFLEDLLKGFVEIGVYKEIVLLAYTQQVEYVKKMFPMYEICEIGFKPFYLIEKLTRGKKSGLRFLRKLGIYKKIVEKRKFSCVWFPYASPDIAVSLNVPTIYTIHDLIQYHNGQFDKQKYKAMVDRCTVIATISEYVKKDIESSFHYNKRIEVIPNAIELNISETKKIDSLDGKKYILDINAFQRRKNALTLLKAYESISKKVTEDLVLCGGRKEEDYFEEIEKFIQKSGLEDRIHICYAVSSEERNWLLQNATLFVTPSLSEGFGRTPVEAAICKVPVISSTVDSLKDVTLGLVNYYENACDEKELSKLILRVLYNGDDEEKILEISNKLQKEYKIETCSTKYWNIVQEISNR